jgi:hypothetical protein
MTKRNIIIIAACGVVVIVGLVLGLTLGGAKSGQTPGKKVMEDTRNYLMQMQRLLDERGELAEPELCDCCDTPVVNGECPYCKGSCDQSGAAGLNRINIVENAPVTEVEGGGQAAAAASGGGGCSCE